MERAVSFAALDYNTDAWKESRQEFGSFEIAPSELECFECIGSGSFGDVYRGNVRGKECAIKKLKGQDMSEDALEEMRKEVQIMSELYHPNIVLFMGACFVKGSMAMVTELMPEGSVSDLVRKPAAHLSLLRKLAIGRDACLGMNWLHTRNPVILHRDLKPANLLVDKHWNVKVCDFGLSTAVERGKMWEDEDDIPGTPLWMAPEVMLGKQIDGKSDVYSFSLCMWELWSGEEPYNTFTNFHDFRHAVCIKKHRPKQIKACPSPVQKLIAMCWDEDPRVRPSFAELIELFPSLSLKCLVRDAAARHFWKDAFFHHGQFPVEVDWDDFAKAFAKFVDLPPASVDDTNFACLKAALSSTVSKPGGNTTVVTVESFGAFVLQFGPLKAGSSCALDALEELAMFKPKTKRMELVFHGNITSTEAEQRLTGHDKGTWLVRVSDKDPQRPFVVSKVSRKGAINHQRIKRSDGVFSVEVLHKNGSEHVESDSDSLVSFLKKLKDDLYLRQAAPGSVFGAIFSEATLAGYL